MIVLRNATTFFNQNPTKIGDHSRFGLYEHPTLGDEAPVIAANCNTGIVFSTGYYDPQDDESDMEDIAVTYLRLLRARDWVREAEATEMANPTLNFEYHFPDLVRGASPERVCSLYDKLAALPH